LSLGLGDLPADQQIAVLLLSIDEELSAKVLRNLADDQVDQVTRAMKQLQELAVDQDAIGSIYRSTIKRLNAGGMALGDVGGHMESVLVKAFGESRGHEATKRANTEILARRPFAMFESLTPQDLAALLAE